MPEPEGHEDLRKRSTTHSTRSATTSPAGRDVTETIPRATEILLDARTSRAPSYMILGDDEIDARCLELEERCYAVLALQAPVASDLRQVVAAMRIIAEIERSADLAVNICKAARRIYGHQLDPELRGIIQQDGRAGAAAVQGGHRGVHDERRARGRGARRHGLATSTTCSASSSQAIFESHAAEKIDLQVAVQLAVVARFYERIGDHAVNIGERVRYIVTGWMPEHKGAALYVTPCHEQPTWIEHRPRDQIVIVVVALASAIVVERRDCLTQLNDMICH